MFSSAGTPRRLALRLESAVSASFTAISRSEGLPVVAAVSTIELVPAPVPDRAVVVELIDFSGSTIGRVGNALAPALMQARQAQVDQGGVGYLWQIGFNDNPFLLDPERPLRELHDTRAIEPDDFTASGFAGGSTALSTSLIVCAALLIAHRQRGHTGELLLAAWTDGRDTSSNDERDRCRRALEAARKAGIRIAVSGFCPEVKWEEYLLWAVQVGLNPDEALVVKLKPGDDISAVAADTARGHSEVVSESIFRRRGMLDGGTSADA